MHPPPPPPAPLGPPGPLPVEGPPVPQPIYTDQKCRIEEIELTAEVCLPTIERDCGPVALEARSVASKESCVDVARTVCTEEEEEVDNELCYYTYSEDSLEGETTTVQVEYELDCEDAPHTYNTYGKDQSKICSNKPKLSPTKDSLTLEYPKAERKCENRPVKLPKVNCEEVVESRCFQLPVSSLETTTLEKCSTILGPPNCRKVPVKLPRQVCSRVLPAPPKPAPAVHPVHAVHTLGGHQPHPVAPGVHTAHALPNLAQPHQPHGLATGAGHSFINFSG